MVRVCCLGGQHCCGLEMQSKQSLSALAWQESACYRSPTGFQDQLPRVTVSVIRARQTGQRAGVQLQTSAAQAAQQLKWPQGTRTTWGCPQKQITHSASSVCSCRWLDDSRPAARPVHMHKRAPNFPPASLQRRQDTAGLVERLLEWRQSLLPLALRQLSQRHLHAQSLSRLQAASEIRF